MSDKYLLELEKQALGILDERGVLSERAMSIHSSYISGTFFMFLLVDDDTKETTEYTFKMDIDVKNNCIKLISTNSWK